MNLIVDMGNSSAKYAVFDGEQMVCSGQFASPFGVDVRLLAEQFPLEACAYACVGSERSALLEAIEECLGRAPLRVTGETPVPLVNEYRTPATLGGDRLAAAVGAYLLSPVGCPVLVVDAGTCITYDFVTADGRYLGGNISPGLGMRLRSLHEHTARLPLIGSEGDCPEVGYDTATAMRAGVVRGLRLEIEGYVRAFRASHPGLKVFFTGGNGSRFSEDIAGAVLHPCLVEEGLNRILLQGL